MRRLRLLPSSQYEHVRDVWGQPDEEGDAKGRESQVLDQGSQRAHIPFPQHVDLQRVHHNRVILRC